MLHRSDDPQIDLVLAITLMDDIGPAAERRADRFVRAPYDEARGALRRYLATEPTNTTLRIAAEQRLVELDEWADPPMPRRPTAAETAALLRAMRAHEEAEKQRLRRLEAELREQQ